jgi:hypothetical protein
MCMSTASTVLYLVEVKSTQQNWRVQQNRRVDQVSLIPGLCRFKVQGNQLKVAETEVHDSIDLQSKGKVILMQSGGDRTPRQVLHTAQVLQ